MNLFTDPKLHTALQLLYCAGRVHRDISSGNILAFADSNTNMTRGILSDLEYVKKSPPGFPSFDPKTVSISLSRITVTYLLYAPGDCILHPFEIQRQQYLSNRERTLPSLIDDWATSATNHEPIIHQPRVQFNFQHNVEALWWVLLRTVTQGPEHEASHDFAEQIFSTAADPPPGEPSCVQLRTIFNRDSNSTSSPRSRPLPSPSPWLWNI